MGRSNRSMRPNDGHSLGHLKSTSTVAFSTAIPSHVARFTLLRPLSDIVEQHEWEHAPQRDERPVQRPDATVCGWELGDVPGLCGRRSVLGLRTRQWEW